MDTFTIVLSDSVDFSHGPVPSNESEQLLFRQHFETLVRLDCMGKLRTGLAEAWTADETGRVWTFVLPDGRFADGSPEAAPRVVSSWRAREAAAREQGIESVAVRDANRLVVTLNQPAGSAPRLFANPVLAISRGPSSLATGSDLRVVQSDGAPTALIQFRIEPNRDLRDALDGGADLVVTRDPALVDYVAGRPEFAAFPLPWSRSYVLLQPPSAEPLDMVKGDADRRSLARDAVSGNARAAEPPFWWNEVVACPTGGASEPTTTSSRVVYIRGDEVAQGLAERIVALAGAGAGLRAAALNPAEFASALKGGSERAYVLAVPRNTLAPCRDISGWPRNASIVPLIDTRAHAIVRKGSPPLSVDWDGTVRILEP